MKQVIACSIIFYRASMGVNAWNTLVLRAEHPYFVRKSEKSLDMGEFTFHAEKTARCRLQEETKVHTVKPPNRGHFGDGPFVPCREVVLFSEVLF